MSSSFVRNLPVVPALICSCLYQLPELVPNIPQRHFRYPDLRLLPHQAWSFRHPHALFGAQGLYLPLLPWL
jgi:hypothetical protein